MSYFSSLNPVFSTELPSGESNKCVRRPTVHRKYTVYSPKIRGLPHLSPPRIGCKLKIEDKLLIGEEILKERLEKVLQKKDNGKRTFSPALWNLRGCPSMGWPT
jgi:hypothetical protein